MNTKRIKVRKRVRIRIVNNKSTTFKKILSNLFANKHVENSWETNVVISFVIVVITVFILFAVFMGPSLFYDVNK